MKVIVVEGRPSANGELSFLLKSEEGVEICAVASNGGELLRLADELQPDAVFLSLGLPEMDGMSAARMLSGKMNAPLLVFVAEVEHYAAEAFTLHAVDYIVRPLTPNRLKDSIQRIREQLDRQNYLARGRTLNNLLLNDDGKIVVVHPDSIIAIIKDEKHVAIHTKQGRCYSSKLTLQELEDKLKAFPFFRTHRSYLINLADVEQLTPWFNGAFNIKLRSSSELKIPVSRDSAKELFRRLGGE